MAVTYAEPSARPPHPVSFDVAYPERLSRLTTFFRLILVIPQLLATMLLLLAVEILTILAWFAILFTGRYPRAFFEFTTGVLRWQANVIAYAALLRDEYPPFSWEPGAYALALDIPYAERQSRVRLFVRLITIIPNYIVFTFVAYGWYFTTFIAWWAILITGRYPRGLFKFSVGVGRWYNRQASYLLLMRDEYPPYSVTAHARPGNEVVSGIIGVPLFAAYVALNLLPFFGLLGGGSTTVAVSRSALESRSALVAAHPSGTANGVRVTLLAFSDRATPDVTPFTAHRFVSFDVRAEKSGRFPSFYSSFFFELHTCQGDAESVDAGASSIHFRVFWIGGSREDTIYFEIPTDATVCGLDYVGGRARLRFVFR